MKLWWASYCDLIDSRNERERMLIMVSILLLITMLFVVFVYDPLKAKKQRALQQQQQTLINTAALQEEIRVSRMESDAISRQIGEQRISELKKSIAHFDRVLQEATVDLIAPQQMAELLQVMMQRQKGLKLVSVKSFTKPVVLNEDGTKVPDDELDETKLTTPPKFYRHGMSLQLEGDFFTVQSYLKSIEASKWNLFWDRLDYRVVVAPKATVTLTIFTLSRDPKWLGLGREVN
ncbi:hypothetical protein MIB92_05000 [Aestuariirhabdus sp. Z084]|uniref:hypothetical protein n=1 Tax=Aestuariirhabdus haliotis TaxID=2918751 RepID=UPI00201B4298|nr:hypothetical protein [Aestuariirhabdus haliotis]MCL6414998.1 hypothetical protein [Aestuariirhabdus haliotis]MCL6418930.1 hypothetical protein [Aestuariirhabdus haliotis]